MICPPSIKTWEPFTNSSFLSNSGPLVPAIPPAICAVRLSIQFGPVVQDVSVIARENHDSAGVPGLTQQRLENGDTPQAPLDRKLLRPFQ